MGFRVRLLMDLNGVGEGARLPIETGVEYGNRNRLHLLKGKRYPAVTAGSQSAEPRELVPTTRKVIVQMRLHLVNDGAGRIKASLSDVPQFTVTVEAVHPHELTLVLRRAAVRLPWSAPPWMRQVFNALTYPWALLPTLGDLALRPEKSLVRNHEH